MIFAYFGLSYVYISLPDSNLPRWSHDILFILVWRCIPTHVFASLTHWRHLYIVDDPGLPWSTGTGSDFVSMNPRQCHHFHLTWWDHSMADAFLRLGVGIHSGSVLVGCIGSAMKMKCQAQEHSGPMCNIKPGFINPKRLFNWGEYHLTIRLWLLGKYPLVKKTMVYQSGFDITVCLCLLFVTTYTSISTKPRGHPLAHGMVLYLKMPGWRMYLATHQWPCNRNRLIGGTYHIYRANFLGLCQGIYPQNMAFYMVQSLHFRILEFPLNSGDFASKQP